MATGICATLLDTLQKEAEPLILGKAKAMQELTEDYMAGVRRYLLGCLKRWVADRLADVALSAELHERYLARASLGYVVRRYIENHTGADTRLAAGVGHDFDYRDTEPMSRLLLTLLTRKKLWLAMIGTALGVIAAGALDYGIVSGLIHEGTRDEVGTGGLSDFELITTSLATVAIYTLMSIAWGKPLARRVLVVALYGLVFAWLGQYVSQGIDEDGSLWTQLRLVGLKTAVYTMPGLLLCVFEHWLVFWVKLTWKYQVAARIVAEADQLHADRRALDQDNEAVQDGRSLADLVDQAMRCSLDQAYGIHTSQHEAAATVQNDLCTDESYKRQAEMQRLKSERCREAIERLQHQPVAPCLLLGLGLSLALAGCGSEASPGSREATLAKANSFAIGVDQSKSSPALDAAWMQANFPYIVDERVKALGMGSRLSVVGLGDMSKVQVEDNTRVQLRASKTGIAKGKALPWVHDRLLALSKPAQPFMKSELVAGVCEVAKLLNPLAEKSELLLLTDGIEESAYADCRKNACKLPSPPCRLPGNASVTMVGVGIGLNGNRGTALQGEWRQFFAKAGVQPGRITIRH